MSRNPTNTGILTGQKQEDRFFAVVRIGDEILTKPEELPGGAFQARKIVVIKYRFRNNL
jgi:hypothetical protein